MTGLWLAPSVTTVSANTKYHTKASFCDSGFLLRRRKANPDLRQSCAQEATRKNQAVGEEAIEPAKNIKKLNQGVCCQGTLLGIGDKHHALAPQLVQALIRESKQSIFTARNGVRTMEQPVLVVKFQIFVPGIIAVTFAAKLNWPFPQSVKISNGKH